MTNILIPMAGFGQRFVDAGFKTIKPLIEIDGEYMAIKSIKSLGIYNHYSFITRRFEDVGKLHTALIENFNNHSICLLEEQTEGPACTALKAKEWINPEEPLIIANCDQIMTWNKKAFTNFCNTTDYDAFVVTFEGGDDRNSFVKLNDDGLCIKFTEKEKISNIALMGIHFWKKAKYFFESAEQMIAQNDRAPNGEFYVSKTYNYLLNKYNVGIYHIPSQFYNSVGTPEELKSYLKRNNNETI